jgi:hypothetical protein
VVSQRVWTVPNALSMLRLLGVPLFLYLVLVAERDGWAILLLMASGITDYLDGYIARRYRSFTRSASCSTRSPTGCTPRDAARARRARRACRCGGRSPSSGATRSLSGVLPCCAARLRPAAGALPRQGGHLQPALRLPHAARGAARQRRPARDVFRPLGWAFATWGQRRSTCGPGAVRRAGAPLLRADAQATRREGPAREPAPAGLPGGRP